MRMNRVLVVYAILFLVVGIIGLVIVPEIGNMLHVRYSSILLISIILILTGTSIFLMLYVRGGIFPSNSKNNNFEYNADNAVSEERFEELRQELLSKFSNFKDLDAIKNEIRANINQQVSQLSEEKIIQQVANRYNNELIAKSKLELIDSELVGIKHRIERETGRISRYGYINLMIGFITTFLAIFFLGYSLLGVQTQNLTTIDYIYHFIPRLSLSVLIEFFAFFFLKLYKRNLEDIKYLNNERTNLEMKIVAIKTGLIYNDKDTINNLVTELAKTERNFVLQKGESTVEIEKNKIDENSSNKLIDMILKIFDKK